jgi:hypothetical protein
MESFFQPEEQYVSEEFDRKCGSASELLRRLLKLIEELLTSSGLRSDQYPEYSVGLHGLHALMALNNSLVLLSRGYMGDAQAAHKRAVEFILRAMYFKEFPADEEKWRDKKGELPNRKEMAKRLDEKHKESRIFPTDYDGLWSGFVYETVYRSVNEWAHGDFKMMYHEVAMDDGTEYVTHKFNVGPRPDETFVGIMLNALIHSCRFQILLLALTFKSPKEKYHGLMMESEDYLMAHQPSAD